MEDYLPLILKIAGGVLIGSAILGAAWHKFREGARKAMEGSLKNWQNLAESRQAVINSLKKENRELEAERSQVNEHLEECKKLRDEFARFNLRLQAREENYQLCINRLERLAGVPPTNFNDPPKAFQ